MPRKKLAVLAGQDAGPALRNLTFFLNNQRYRPIVDQLDLHHGPKSPGRGWNAVCANSIDKRFVKRNRRLRRRSVDEAWPTALAAIAVEGELAYHQDRAADIK